MQLLNFVALLAAGVTSVYAQSLQINTPPSTVECEPAQLTWSGGTPPYFLSVLPAGQITAPAIESLGQTNATTVTWKVDIQAGQSVTLQIRDGAGQLAYSAPVPITAGPDTSCVGKGSGVVSSGPPVTGSAPGGTPTTASAPSSPTSGAAPSGTTPAATNKPATSSGASSSPSTASQTPKAAGAISLTVGPATGIIGVLLGVFLA